MAGIPISGLPPVVSSLLTDEFPVVQAGVTSKATLAQVQILFGFPSGIVPLSQGGTSAALTASNGGVVVSTASALTILSTLANGALVTDGSGIPSISLTLPLPVQSNITELGAQSQALNMNNHQINNVTDPTASKDAVNLEYLSSQLGFYLPLSGGTMSGLINMGSNKITALATPTVSTDAVNKAYVDSVASGFNVQPACYAATTANLAGYIYNNASSGVGATLTAGANGAFTTDATTPPTNARILVWVQTTTFQNGIFVLSQTGDATHPAILTRSTDYNQPAQIQPGDLVIINNGTTYGGTSFIETASVTAVGTDPILFSQFTFSASQVLLKANNLSDVANKTTAFNNISPLTTQGDLITRDTTNNIRLASVNSASLVTSLTGVPTWLGPKTNGQIVIGSTGATPVLATLTAGIGITITNGAGSITIAGGGGGLTWNEVTGTSQAMSTDNGYISNNASLVTLTLPVTAALGTQISVIGKGAGGWKIAQNASQFVQLGSTASTTGVGGSIASTNRYDSIELICTTANTTWSALSGPQGNITIV